MIDIEKNYLNKISHWVLSSPFPLLVLGGMILFFYTRLGFLGENIFGKNLYVVIHRYNSLSFEILKYCWLIFLCVGVAIWLAKQQSIKFYVRRSHWIVAGVFFLLFCGVLITTNPIFSQDIFWNLFHGKIFTQYHQNPYLVAPKEFLQDPYLSYIPDWQDFKMTHGPIWTLIVSTVIALFPRSLVLQILGIRIILFGILAALIYFIINTVNRLNPRWAFPSFIALSWQPLLLIDTVNGAHNDILVGAGIIIGLCSIAQSKYLRGFLVLWLTVLTKYIALLLIPLGIVLMLRRHGWQSTAKFGFKIALICLFLTFVFYLPFGYGKYLFTGLTQQSHCFNYDSSSPATFWLATVGFSFTGVNREEILNNQNKCLPTSPIFRVGNSYEFIVLITRLVSTTFFILGYLWLLLKNFRDSQDFLKGGFFIITLFLLLVPTWFMAWYLIWLIPLATLFGFLTTLLTLIWSVLTFPYPSPILYIFGAIFGLLALVITAISRPYLLALSKSPKYQATYDSGSFSRLKENHNSRAKNTKN